MKLKKRRVETLILPMDYLKLFIILTLKIINIKRKLDSIAARQNSIVSYN